MKKILSVFLSLTMVFSLSLPSFVVNASEKTSSYSITINEYDVYVNVRKTEDDKLSRAGFSSEQTALIKSDIIENELTKLSNLSSAELISLGYNKQQIETLHNYEGERIETVPKLRGVFADMSINFYPFTANSTSLSVQVEWSWSNAPLLAGSMIEDMVAMRWKGTDDSGSPLNVAFVSSGSYCSIKYYYRTGSYHSSKRENIVCDSPYDHAYAKIPMCPSSASTNIYAKQGIFTVKVQRTGSNSIKEAAFVFAYGHTIAIVSPSLSLPPSFGIGFSFGTETMAEQAIRMDRNGIITAY